jgi:dolichol-phosphate mannosyltransferase
MKFVLVIPTYNEAENIGKLIEALVPVFNSMSGHVFEILVVEGNSPDGTADVVKEKEKKYNFVHLLMEKEKAGLGAAYMYGFKHAMKELQPDVLIEMDADFQHDPKELPKLVRGIEEGGDYVIGSRYIKGGSIPKEWGFRRKFLSIVGNKVAKLVLGVREVNDFTAGFRASRVKGYIDSLDLDSILSSGFSYKMDLLYRLKKMGATIVEVPSEFGLRDRGDSKMEQNNAIDSLRVVFSLRMQDSQTFIKFCAVGLVGFVTDMTLANLFRLTPLYAGAAASLSALIAMLVTFFLNNMWSFAHSKKTSVQHILRSLLVYIPLTSVPIVFRFWFVGFVSARYGDTFLVYNSAILVSIILGLIWNYFTYSKIIWKKEK